jgi:hypothetical protein
MEKSLETGIVEVPLNQDAQLVLEATFNREAPIVLEAPLVQDTRLYRRDMWRAGKKRKFE